MTDADDAGTGATAAEAMLGILTLDGSEPPNAPAPAPPITPARVLIVRVRGRGEISRGDGAAGTPSLSHWAMVRRAKVRSTCRYATRSDLDPTT